MMEAAIWEQLSTAGELSIDQLLEQRWQRFRKFGARQQA